MKKLIVALLGTLVLSVPSHAALLRPSTETLASVRAVSEPVLDGTVEEARGDRGTLDLVGVRHHRRYHHRHHRRYHRRGR